MSEILIRGMEMPVEQPVTLILDPSGRVWLPDIETSKEYMAHELPPHGDLIDRREIISDLDTAKQHPDFNGWDSYADGFARAFIETAPVVVPAERSGKNA